MAVDKHNIKLGKKGERIARRYLFFKGYKILEKNYKCPMGEIDIIAEKKGTVAFIEVKSRLTDRYGSPSEAVDEKRRQRYIRSALFYFSGREIDRTVRFDVIEVFKGRVNHIISAFENTGY